MYHLPLVMWDAPGDGWVSEGWVWGEGKGGMVRKVVEILGPWEEKETAGRKIGDCGCARGFV